jgi:ABC-2 type transport system ATP-binding protein
MTESGEFRYVSQQHRAQFDNEVIIKTEILSKQFNGNYAVKDISFYVPKGKIFGFIGPSGAGKTTTIRLLTGDYVPTSGKVSVFGRPPTKFTQSMKARIGYMSQNFILYQDLSIWENLNFTASIYGMPLFRGQHLREVLDFVELTSHRSKLARDISGGMQRRLALAATLVHNPDLIFLDEPTGGVDPILRSKFWHHFLELRDAGHSLFITTQYVSETAYCDLVGVMGEGFLIVVDTPDGLRYRAYGGDILELRTTERIDYRTEYHLKELPMITHDINRTGPNSLRLIVDEAKTVIPTLIDWCRDRQLTVESIEEYHPPLDDVYVELVKKGNHHD